MFGFPIPDIQIQTPKTPEKETRKQASTNTPFLVQGTQKALKMETLNQQNINENLNPDLTMSFVVLPVSQDRPRVPQDAK